MNSSNPASISSASVRHSHLHLIFRSNKKNGKLQEKFNSCYQSLRRNRRAPVEWTLDSNVPATYLTAREHHYKARTGFIFLAKKPRSTVRFSWFQTWLLLNNIQPFQWAYRLHRPLLRASGLWEREWLWDRKRRRLPRWAGSPRNFKPCFKVYCVRQRYSSRCFLLNNRIQPRTACWSIITLVFSEGFSFNSGGIYLQTIEQNLNSGAKDKFRVRS